MGAAYSSLGGTKVLYATSLVLRGAKAKFLRRKPSVLVALEEISEMWELDPNPYYQRWLCQGIFLTERFPKFGCEGSNQRETVCDADAESLS